MLGPSCRFKDKIQSKLKYLTFRTFSRDVFLLTHSSQLIPNARSQLVRVKRLRNVIFDTCIETLTL